MITNDQLAFDDKSHAMIEQAIAVLGGGAVVREVLSRVYALGRIDGRSEQLDSQRATLEAALKAVA